MNKLVKYLLGMLLVTLLMAFRASLSSETVFSKHLEESDYALTAVNEKNQKDIDKFLRLSAAEHLENSMHVFKGQNNEFGRIPIHFNWWMYQQDVFPYLDANLMVEIDGNYYFNWAWSGNGFFAVDLGVIYTTAHIRVPVIDQWEDNGRLQLVVEVYDNGFRTSFERRVWSLNGSNTPDPDLEIQVPVFSGDCTVEIQVSSYP